MKYYAIKVHKQITKIASHSNNNVKGDPIVHFLLYGPPCIYMYSAFDSIKLPTRIVDAQVDQLFARTNLCLCTIL